MATMLAPLITETMGTIGSEIISSQAAGMSQSQYLGILGTAAANMRQRTPQFQEQMANDYTQYRQHQIREQEMHLPIGLGRQLPDFIVSINDSSDQIDSSQINPMWQRNQDELKKQSMQTQAEMVQRVAKRSGKVPKIKLPKEKVAEIKKATQQQQQNNDDEFIKDWSEFDDEHVGNTKQSKSQKQKKTDFNPSDNPDNDPHANPDGGNDDEEYKAPKKNPGLNIPQLPQGNSQIIKEATNRNKNKNDIKNENEIENPKVDNKIDNKIDSEDLISKQLQQIHLDLDKLNEKELLHIQNYFVQNDINSNQFKRIDPDAILSSILSTI